MAGIVWRNSKTGYVDMENSPLQGDGFERMGERLVVAWVGLWALFTR